MISFTQIARTSGKALATALLAAGLIAGAASANTAEAGNNWGNNGRGWTFNWAPALALGALASGLNSRDNRADERAAFNRGFLAGRNNFYARPPVVYNIQPHPPGTVWYQQPMQLQGRQPAYRNGWRLSAQIRYDPSQFQRPPSADIQIGQVSPPPAGLQLPRGIQPGNLYGPDHGLANTVVLSTESGLSGPTAQSLANGNPDADVIVIERTNPQTPAGSAPSIMHTPTGLFVPGGSAPAADSTAITEDSTDEFHYVGRPQFRF